MADTGYQNPTADAAGVGGFGNPANAYTSDNLVAAETTPGDNHIYRDYSFSIPTGSTIDGVDISVEALTDGEVFLNGDKAVVNVAISIDGGANYSATKSHNYLVVEGEIIQLFGGATDNWGLSPIDTSFTNANFRVRVGLTSLSGGAVAINIDHIKGKVFYTEAAAAAVIPSQLGTPFHPGKGVSNMARFYQTPKGYNFAIEAVTTFLKDVVGRVIPWKR